MQSMSNKAQAGSGMMGLVITTVVVVILGVVFLQVVDDETSKLSEAQSVTDELITGSNTSAVSLANDDLESNATCNCTPYFTTLTTGTVLHTNDTCNSASVSCDYDYYDDNYASSSTTRTISGLVPVMWAVVLLSLVAVGFIMGKM